MKHPTLSGRRSLANLEGPESRTGGVSPSPLCTCALFGQPQVCINIRALRCRPVSLAAHTHDLLTPELFGGGSHPQDVEYEEDVDEVVARFSRGSHTREVEGEDDEEQLEARLSRGYHPQWSTWASGIVKALKARSFSKASLINEKQPD